MTKNTQPGITSQLLVELLKWAVYGRSQIVEGRIENGSYDKEDGTKAIRVRLLSINFIL